MFMLCYVMLCYVCMYVCMYDKFHRKQGGVVKVAEGDWASFKPATDVQSKLSQRRTFENVALDITEKRVRLASASHYREILKIVKMHGKEAGIPMSSIITMMKSYDLSDDEIVRQIGIVKWNGEICVENGIVLASEFHRK